MKRWFIIYNGRVSNVSFTSKEKAEEYACIGLETALDAITGWAAGTHYEKNYIKDVEDVFKMDVVCYKMERV
jgi:hypothetical protein